MKTHTLSQLQKELATLPPKEALEICIKLAKYKKENKEYLNFLLFGVHDKENYFEKIKESLEDSFSQVSRTTAWTTKKGLQKMARLIQKHVKQSGSLQTEIELRIWFCKRIRQARIDLDASQVTANLFYREIERIKVVYGKLHEDLRTDYNDDLERLNIRL
jgi:hypothetical protein